MINSIKEFWDYFDANKFIFHILNELDKPTQKEKIGELHRLINVFDPHIGFILKLDKIFPELIVTAYGNPYLFKSVELLMKFAPQLENFKITAFVQPSTTHNQYLAGTDQPLYYYGLELKISEMRYISFPTENNPLLISMDLYIPIKIVRENQNRIRGAVYLALEHLLGEKVFANEIHYINIFHIDSDQMCKSFPLRLLPEYIKNTNKEYLSLSN